MKVLIATSSRFGIKYRQKRLSVYYFDPNFGLLAYEIQYICSETERGICWDDQLVNVRCFLT